MRKHFIRDLDECQRLWNRFIIPKNISDCWDFRICFHRHFEFEPCFLVLEDPMGISAMLPLSYARDVEMFVFFPGEIWNNRTWIERTPIYIREAQLMEEILASCPERTYLRYMEPWEGPIPSGLEIDEVGYSLQPPLFDFDPGSFHKRFSNKKIKDIMKVIRSFMENGGQFHLNRLTDFDLLVEMSLGQFGSDSYLYDDRFRDGFRDLVHFLHGSGWLRMVSLEIEGKTVAVDIGALYGGTYTLFLGGTDPEVKGVAKVMNMGHIEFACLERVSKIDFLCGDFHWKKLWHLDPEPLYKFVTPSLIHEEAYGHTSPYQSILPVTEGLIHA